MKLMKIKKMNAMGTVRESKRKVGRWLVGLKHKERNGESIEKTGESKTSKTT